MRIEPSQPIAAAVGWAQEWQHFGWTATKQSMRCYLQGCAHIAMAPTPQQALAALHEAETGLLRHYADTFAEAARLVRKQSAEHVRAPQQLRK